MKSCFFIGHCDTNGELYPFFLTEVEGHITEYGVTDSFVGHYGNFDCMAAKVVKEATKQHPEVSLTLMLPYHPSHPPHRNAGGLRRHLLPLGGRANPQAPCYC